MVKVDKRGRIGRFLPCQGCGYELRGCHPMGNCPECGRPIRQTLRRLRELLRKQTTARPDWWGIAHWVFLFVNAVFLFVMLLWTMRVRFFGCILLPDEFQVACSRLTMTVILGIISLYIHIHLFRWRVEHSPHDVL